MSAQTEHDVVLSAIRRGEASLPAIKRATGIDYPKLQTVLHALEFDWRSIKRDETVDGFDRYTPAASEKTSPRGDKIVTPAIPPAATSRTSASLDAAALTVEQRSAPHCVKCQAVTVIHGVDRDGRRRWKCQSCQKTFLGTSANGGHAVTKPDPHAEARDRLNEMIARGQRPQPALASEKPDDEALDAAEESGLCGCGRSRLHVGRCGFRRQREKERQERLEASIAGNGDVEESAEIVFNPIKENTLAEEPVSPYEAQKITTAAPIIQPPPIFEGGYVSFEVHFNLTINQMLDWGDDDLGKFWSAVRLLRKMGAQIKEASQDQ